MNYVIRHCTHSARRTFKNCRGFLNLHYRFWTWFWSLSFSVISALSEQYHGMDFTAVLFGDRYPMDYFIPGNCIGLFEKGYLL